MMVMPWAHFCLCVFFYTDLKGIDKEEEHETQPTTLFRGTNPKFIWHIFLLCLFLCFALLYAYTETDRHTRVANPADPAPQPQVGDLQRPSLR